MGSSAKGASEASGRPPIGDVTEFSDPVSLWGVDSGKLGNSPVLILRELSFARVEGLEIMCGCGAGEVAAVLLEYRETNRVPKTCLSEGTER